MLSPFLVCSNGVNRMMILVRVFYSSMKPNLVVLLADLFNLFEIHPAKCVCYPGMEQQPTGKSVGSTLYTVAALVFLVVPIRFDPRLEQLS